MNEQYDSIYYKKDAISRKRVSHTADIEQYFCNESQKHQQAKSGKWGTKSGGSGTTRVYVDGET